MLGRFVASSTRVGSTRQGGNNMKRTAVIVSTLALLVAACSPSDVAEELAEQIAESQEGIENVEIDEDDGTIEFEIQDEEGDVTAVIGGGDIPDGFPIPVPGGGEVMAVVQQGSDTTVSIAYDSSDFGSVKDFYEDWIEGSGAEVVQKFETSAPLSVAWILEKGSASYNITVVEAGPQTMVSLLVLSG